VGVKETSLIPITVILSRESGNATPPSQRRAVVILLDKRDGLYGITNRKKWTGSNTGMWAMYADDLDWRKGYRTSVLEEHQIAR
jgi:hypothetical protein